MTQVFMALWETLKAELHVDENNMKNQEVSCVGNYNFCTLDTMVLTFRAHCQWMFCFIIKILESVSRETVSIKFLLHQLKITRLCLNWLLDLDEGNYRTLIWWSMHGSNMIGFKCFQRCFLTIGNKATQCVQSLITLPLRHDAI